MSDVNPADMQIAEQFLADLEWLKAFAAARQWVFILKADGERRPDKLPWTAALLGVYAEHATTPHEAAAKLRAFLENR